jgi:hypothetical protein
MEEARTSVNFVATAVEVVAWGGGGLQTGPSGSAYGAGITERQLERGPSEAVTRDSAKIAARSLYDQLQTHKQTADDAALEREKSRFVPKGLDEEDVEFLDAALDAASSAQSAAVTQAQRDREAFEAALRSAAEARALQEDSRIRAALGGTAAPQVVRAAAGAASARTSTASARAATSVGGGGAAPASAPAAARKRPEQEQEQGEQGRGSAKKARVQALAAPSAAVLLGRGPAPFAPILGALAPPSQKVSLLPNALVDYASD